MDQENQILNKVSASGLITFELDDYYEPGERVLLDIKDQLYQGLILREKEFRQFVKATDWSQYMGKHVALSCSSDAIIQAWAFMLLGVALQPYAATVVYGDMDDLEIFLFRRNLDRVNWSLFHEEKVVVKGCSKFEVPAAIYLEVSMKLRPIVSSLMFGEPCSTVPVFKRKP